MESYISNTFNYVKEKTGNMIPEILLVTSIIFLVLILINVYGIDMNPPKSDKLVKVVTVENFENTIKSFCEVYETDAPKLEKACNNLTKENCNATSCCIWLNNSKCVAGNQGGPKFKDDENKQPISIDSYYYKNKCFGKNCPK